MSDIIFCTVLNVFENFNTKRFYDILNSAVFSGTNSFPSIPFSTDLPIPDLTELCLQRPLYSLVYGAHYFEALPWCLLFNYEPHDEVSSSSSGFLM